MVAHFQRVRVLGRRAPAPPWAMSRDAWRSWSKRRIDELPERAQKLLENVPVWSRTTLGRAGRRRLRSARARAVLGRAVPDIQRCAATAAPRAVFLYKRNIERVARSTAEVEREIRTTLLHETGHFFGMDEADLEEVGLD